MGWKSLLTLGFVKATERGEATTYTITEKGKATLATKYIAPLQPIFSRPGSGRGFLLALRYTAAMSRWLRYLRIAFSVTCGIACVLVVMLWVRSYWTADYVERINGKIISSILVDTGMIFCRHGDKRPYPNYVYRTEWLSFPANNHPHAASFELEVSGKTWIVDFPCWLPVIGIGILAGISCLPWRFSLRTLLIATTLIAVVLGAIVCAAK